jgi:hypothetical protein
VDTKNVKERTSKRNKVISGEAKECSFINPRIKSKLKLFCREQISQMKLSDILYDLGMTNMQVKDIANILRIKPIELQAMLDQGKKDLEEGIDSDEREMFVSYQTGLKSLEGHAVIQMMRKSPDKLLAIINPDVYSDEVKDKYEVPNINIIFGDKEKTNLEEIENQVKESLNIKDEE